MVRKLKTICLSVVMFLTAATSALAGSSYVITTPENVEIEFYVVQAAWFQLLLAIALVILSIILAPKPQKNKPAEIEDFDRPTADLDRPIPVICGCVWTPGNVVAATDIGHQTFKIRA